MRVQTVLLLLFLTDNFREGFRAAIEFLRRM